MIASHKLYLYAKSLVSALPGIMHFDWWNNNILDDGIGTPFPTPAVFFEYNGIVWEPSTQGSSKNNAGLLPQQSGAGEFTLHIVYKKIESSAIDAAELSHVEVVESVYTAVHFKGTSENYLKGHIQRIRDEQIQAHRVLRDWPVAFSFGICEAPIADPQTQDLTPWTAEIAVDVVDANLDPVEPYTGPGPGITIEIKEQ